jgi:hypothetical protein
MEKRERTPIQTMDLLADWLEWHDVGEELYLHGAKLGTYHEMAEDLRSVVRALMRQ